MITFNAFNINSNNISTSKTYNHLKLYFYRALSTFKLDFNSFSTFNILIYLSLLNFYIMGDVLGELMGIYQTLLEPSEEHDILSNSSIRLESIMFEAANKDANLTTQSMEIMKSALNKLYDQIDFLKEELQEKNLLIKSLVFINANDHTKINRSLVEDQSSLSASSTVEENTSPSMLETTSTNSSFSQTCETSHDDNLVDYEESGNNDTINTITTQLDNYKLMHKERYELINANNISKSFNQPNESILCSTPADTMDKADEDTSENIRCKHAQKFAWEKHSSGIASKIVNQMGYEGKGLGKFQNGIQEAIKVKSASRFGTAETDEKEGEKRKTICILSGSMLNQLDAKRLSTTKYDVKIRCHGGCTLQCLYTHLPWAFNLQPEHIIIHVGTNDCAKKTSDEVLRELFNIKIYIRKVLPSCKVWISLPTMRTDNNRANTIIRNLNLKMKKHSDMIIDHSNINERHLSKKGLHLNDHGIKEIARNIISHIKRL